MAEHVEIVEMAARDGLQNEKRFVPTADKIALIDRLSGCGYARIEATSFVSPKWVPQLADAADVMAGIRRADSVRYSVLVPNMKGYEAAAAANVDEVAVFISASEGFSKANINCTIAESIERLSPVIGAAINDGLAVRGYVSCAIECPYDGPTAPQAVADVTEQLFSLGCHEVSLGDTIGRGTPDKVAAMLDAVLAIAPAHSLAGHYHDTGGRALDNIRVSLEKGLRVFDASVGGLGGCPFAPGAKGNVDTVAVAELLHGLGFETGLDLDKLRSAALFAQALRQDRAA
ncbi:MULTISPECIES: hydroxymethylglutaryl-CoA lyase [Brucella]|uniref:Hydroxymethylglutaryl-CoA lyase n=2 Tax=Ochrobactrum TaxID=528 RepID=A0A2P9HJ53_9HYPH|nr:MULTISPECIES: hydroxymethylglutaryl-CoA lyase [Brucella]RRD27779.1 hydroxymethylglutaryl-CoA lyase [Brucellaceae bacterium VT-16-1752]WHT41362.1 hydroxymethylglutaryl-CoA lyase [Ochrobactrum sp. SSR]MDX4073924.1 hydroxymethylglutaryl-CoA lyase [Brucella sp. NBRC 113783]NNU59102.1 hydroxymethylglutaryl-CoA lyase [[Ochrobactrum] soli]TNV17156.1 hydroxymethylglutaryl-CoA lyase [[Ochrobactrum] teleogrylli]